MIAAALQQAKRAVIAIRNDRVVRLALKKIGQATCRHNYQLVQTKDRLFLRCPTCTRESVGFTVGERRAS